MRPRLHPQHRSRETYPPRPQQQLRLRRPEYLADRQSVLGVSRGLVLGWPKPDGEPAAGGGGVSQLAVLRAAPKLSPPDGAYLPGEAALHHSTRAARARRGGRSLHHARWPEAARLLL